MRANVTALARPGANTDIRIMVSVYHMYHVMSCDGLSGILNVLEDPGKALKLLSRLLVLQPDNIPVQQQVQHLKNYLHKDSL